MAAMALVAGATSAHAGTQTGSALASTVSPATLTRTADLDFGTLIGSATAGTAVINPNTDARSVTGGVVAFGGTPSAAHFTAVGRVGLIALITLPTTITLTHSSGVGTMTVNNVTTNGGTTRLFPLTATIDVAVGGTLNIAGNQKDGAYSGTFNVTAIYF